MCFNFRFSSKIPRTLGQAPGYPRGSTPAGLGRTRLCGKGGQPVSIAATSFVGAPSRFFRARHTSRREPGGGRSPAFGVGRNEGRVKITPTPSRSWRISGFSARCAPVRQPVLRPPAIPRFAISAACPPWRPVEVEVESLCLRLPFLTTPSKCARSPCSRRSRQSSSLPTETYKLASRRRKHGGRPHHVSEKARIFLPPLSRSLYH